MGGEVSRIGFVVQVGFILSDKRKRKAEVGSCENDEGNGT